MAKNNDGPVKTFLYWVAALIVMAFIFAMVGDAAGWFELGD
jgi:hypothetical protein